MLLENRNAIISGEGHTGGAVSGALARREHGKLSVGPHVEVSREEFTGPLMRHKTRFLTAGAADDRMAEER